MTRREQFLSHVGIRAPDLPSRRKINLYTSPISQFVRPRKTVKILLMVFSLNVLMPTGYVTYHQFNIQQFYILPALYLCVLYLSQNKQRFLPRRHKLVRSYYRDEKCLLRGTD